MTQDIKATDLLKIAVLGSGAFGQVMLVKHESAYMALKSLSKQQILEMGLQVSMLAFNSFPVYITILPTLFIPSIPEHFCGGNHLSTSLC